MNIPLKLKIIENYGNQFGFSLKAGVHEAIVSRVVRGHRKISEDEQRRWAGLLNCRREDIFSDGRKKV